MILLCRLSIFYFENRLLSSCQKIRRGFFDKDVRNISKSNSLLTKYVNFIGRMSVVEVFLKKNYVYPK